MTIVEFAGCAQQVESSAGHFRAVMPGTPVQATSVREGIESDGYAVERWGCSFTVAVSESLLDGLSSEEARILIATIAKSLGADDVTAVVSVPWGEDNASEFSVDGSEDGSEIKVEGRVGSAHGRVYLWYVKCRSERWRIPWTRYYAQRFLASLEALD